MSFEYMLAYFLREYLSEEGERQGELCALVSAFFYIPN